MAKLPDPQALGPPDTPEPKGQIAGISRPGIAEATQSEESLRGVGELANQLAQASDRIMTREETVERARAYGEFESAASEELRRLSTEGDFSKLETTRQYGEFLSKKQKEILGAHAGRGDSLAALSARLETSRLKFADHAAGEGLKAQQQLVADSLGGALNSITDRAYRTNERIDDLFNEADSIIRDMAPALPLGDELKSSRIAKEKIGMARFNQLLDSGAYGEAKKLRDSMPLYGQIFGAESQKSINHRILGQEQKAIEEATSGMRKARQAIIEAQIKSDAVGGTPDEKKKNFSRALGLGPEKETEFDRLSKELINMEQSGLKETQDYKLKAARMAKLISTEKLSVSFDPKTGEFSLTQGGAVGNLGDVLSPTQKPSGGLASGLTPPQALSQSERLDNLNDTVKSLDTTINAIVEDPTRAGIFGSVRRITQTAVGVGGDLAKIVSKTTGVDLRKLGLSARDEIISDQNIPKNVKDALMPYFDPKLTEMELFENTLAIQLAKLRILSGGSDIRAIESAFKVAQKDTKVTGLKSSQEVLVRLNKIRDEFITERDRRASRLGGEQQALPNDFDERLKTIFGKQ